MENIKFWTPPFKLYFSYVYNNQDDESDQLCFMFDLDSWDYEKDLEIKEEVIEILNGKIDKKITSKLKIVDGYKIYMDGNPFITVRWWGYLTGHGAGALWLNHDVAKKIQDDFALWILNKLTK